MKTTETTANYTRPTRRVMRALRASKTAKLAPRALQSRAGLDADGLADAVKRLTKRGLITVDNGFVAIAA